VADRSYVAENEALEENERKGLFINPLRADHRAEHLDEIERMRSRR
jgi:hypothetical protein